MINLSTTVNHLDHYIHINKEAREDLRWWHEFLSEWNDISMIPEDREGQKVYLFTDASNLGLGGGVFGLSNAEQSLWEVLAELLHPQDQDNADTRDLTIEYLQARLLLTMTVTRRLRRNSLSQMATD